MLEEIAYYLIKTTESRKIKWTEQGPLSPYGCPTSIVQIHAVTYQIQLTGEKTGFFEICNNDGVSVGVFQDQILATAVKAQIQANRKSAQFELKQQLQFMSDPTSNDGV
jgi:hypothetical protein